MAPVLVGYWFEHQIWHIWFQRGNCYFKNESKSIKHVTFFPSGSGSGSGSGYCSCSCSFRLITTTCRMMGEEAIIALHLGTGDHKDFKKHERRL